MTKILEKKVWWTDAPAIKEFVVEAPWIAEKHKAGQFVILRAAENGERIPLTISDKNVEKGTINILFQEVGKTTMTLAKLNAGDNIFRSEEHTSELQSQSNLVCRLLLEKN